METELLFSKTLLDSIQYCHNSFVSGKKINEICDDILLKLLKVSGSQYGFVSEYTKDKDPYFHHLTTNNNALFDFCRITKKLIISNGLLNECIKSFSIIPLFFKKKFIGTIGIANRKDGYNVEFIEKIQPIIDTIAHIVGFLLYEKKSDDDLEILKRKRSCFSAKITHDIRTPIGAIIGVLTLLKKNTVLNDTQTQYVNMIDSCSIQLLSLINDLLDFSKCNDGKMNVHCKSMNLKKCLEDVYDINFAKANEKNINISYIINDDVPTYIVSDEGKIKQILINLLSNAIKFTNSGSILTYIRVCNDQKTIIKFSVYDTGIGIHEKYLNDIFNIYEQIENEYNRTITGTGLGLSICKDFVKLLGGKIGVNSTIGKGSEFYFTIEIPCDKSNNNNYLKNKHVVIVDDEIINRMLYNNIFTEMGMKTHMFSNGNKAIKYICDHKDFINVAFIDVHMPIMDGIELARKLKSLDNKIILISVTADTSMKRTEFSEIFDQNIYTPVDKIKLRDACIDLVIKSERKLKRKISRYTSPRACNTKPLWFISSICYPDLKIE